MISDFLITPKNTVLREKLFKHRFLYEAQLEFIKINSRIIYYESDCDRDGFDIVFDNLTNQRHIQLKSVIAPAKTNSFYIHRNLLRPRINHLNKYPLSHDSYGVGYGGGVILIEAKEQDNNLLFQYKYTDGLILSLFYAGYIKYRSAATQDSVIKSFRDFSNPLKRGEQMKVTKPCFLHFKSLIDIFNYLGLTKYHDNDYQNLQDALARRFGLCSNFEKEIPIQAHSDKIKTEFSKLIHCDKLEFPILNF